MKKWLSIKSVLFTYLALNKVLYWFNTITTLEQTDFRIVADVFISRFLNQDLILILGVIAFSYLNYKIEQKGENQNSVFSYIIFYTVGYIMLICLIFIYFLIVALILHTEYFYFIGYIRMFLMALPTATVLYIAACATLEVKEYFKAKEKEKLILSEKSEDN